MTEQALLALCLYRLDWSPERLAREINKLCGDGTISLKAPYGWLKGSCPRGRLPQIVARILTQHLGEPVTAGALWPSSTVLDTMPITADAGLDLPWTAQGTWRSAGLLVDQVAMKAPSLVLQVDGSALIRPAVDWLTADDAPLMGRARGAEISPQIVDVLADRVGQLRRLDDLNSGRLTLDWTIEDLKWTARLVRDSAYDEATGARLYGVMAELCQLAGWVCADLELHALGQRFLMIGLRAAHTAGDRDLGANIVSCLSYQAGWNAAYDDALRLIKIARAGLRADSSEAMRALLASRQARAHAQLGQRGDCERALDEAAEFTGRLESQRPVWAYWVTDAVLVADAGRSWLELGDPVRAQPLLKQGLSLFGETQPRNRMLHHISLAESYLTSGDLEEALASATCAIDVGHEVRSRRAAARLRLFQTHLTSRDGSQVREVNERIDDALAGTAAT